MNKHDRNPYPGLFQKDSSHMRHPTLGPGERSPGGNALDHRIVDAIPPTQTLLRNRALRVIADGGAHQCYNPRQNSDGTELNPCWSGTSQLVVSTVRSSTVPTKLIITT